MKLSPNCISFAIGLGWITHGPARAGLPFRAGKPWTESAPVEVLLACAVLLSLLALALLWRCQALRRALLDAQHRLAAEQALRAGAESALLETRGQLCRLAATEEQLLQTERRRIAGDIHDDLGQNLLALKMRICALHASTSLPPWLKQQLGTIASHIDLTVRSMRSVINDLRPAALEHGLRAAVERQLQEFGRLSGVRYQLETSRYSIAGMADAGADRTVFRILQEALSNIARHAGASEIKVALCRSAQQLSLTVQDNGVGLRPAMARGGYGLPGIEERVKAAGGCYALDSAPGYGTVLRIAIPALRRQQAPPSSARPVPATAAECVNDQAAA